MEVKLLSLPSYTDAETVDQNAAGRVTGQQRQALKTTGLGALGCGTRMLTLLQLPVFCLFAVIALALLRLNFWIILLLGGASALVIGGMWIHALGGFYRQNADMQKDLAAGVTRSADGEVIYGKRGYIARVKERDLTLPNGLGGLYPGVAYTFHYLPSSGVVLSAVERMPGFPHLAEEGLRKALMAAHRFDADDLSANRRGRIAAPQMKRFMPQLVGGFAASALGGGVALFTLYFNFLKPGAPGVDNWVGVAIQLVFAAVFLLAGLNFFLRAMADLFNGKVEYVEGVGKKTYEVVSSRSRSGGVNSSVQYFYQVNEDRFRVPARAYQSLIDGVQYRLYHTPYSRVAVAIEPLESPMKV